MEFQPEANNAQYLALNNPIILTAIFKQASTPLKTCRLVSQFWNEMILSMPKTRLALQLNPRDERSEFSFFELSSSFDARLAKMINYPSRMMDPFPWKLIHVCKNFTNNVQILELQIHEVRVPTVYQILKTSCPNLTQLRIRCKFLQSSENLIPAGASLPAKRNLTLFTVTAERITAQAQLTSFIDVVVNASPNLSGVTLPWGFFPDLSNCKGLDSLTIALDNVAPNDIARTENKLSELSRMVRQVSHQLVQLSFEYVEDAEPIDLDTTMNFKKIKVRLPFNMLKLQIFRNQMTDVFRCNDLLQHIVPNLKTLTIGKAFEKSKSVDEVLQNICSSKKKILPNMRNLTIVELHDPKLLKGLVTSFPNLEKLKLETFNTTDFRGKNSRMKLGLVLKACEGWKKLKHLELGLPAYPEYIEYVVKDLLKAKKLFKRLKTLTIGTFDCDKATYDLSEDEMDLFKQLLVALGGMDRVVITDLCFSKESAQSILAFMELNAMPVSKFSVVEEGEMDEDTDDYMDEDSVDDWYISDDNDDNDDFPDDWREIEDEESD